jgi:hypothetical protein
MEPLPKDFSNVIAGLAAAFTAGVGRHFRRQKLWSRLRTVSGDTFWFAVNLPSELQQLKL